MKRRLGEDPLDDIGASVKLPVKRAATKVTRTRTEPQPPSAAARPAAARAPVDRLPTVSWEDSNQRVTFHCPKELKEWVEGQVTPTLSKSRLIVTALQEYRTKHGG